MTPAIWNQTDYDPYNHMGSQVIADVRRSRIVQQARVGTNTRDWITVSRHLTQYAMGKAIQEAHN